MSENRCVLCGEIIPEGRMVCRGCEDKLSSGTIGSLDEEKKTILDSGNRREFKTGAVRDIQEGKGRCDLMPLDVVASMFEKENENRVLKNIGDFQETNAEVYLLRAIEAVSSNFGGYPDMFLEVAKHFEEGAKKYGENNWQKGLPINCYIDSAVRHYLKWIRGDEDERHDRAFVWNLLCCVWTLRHKKPLTDSDIYEEASRRG